MTSTEFDSYYKHSVQHYAEEKIASGNWNKEEAYQKSREELEHLLPDRERTKHHYLYTIYDDEQPVGIIWLAERANQTGFIYDIHISDQFQGQGYGKKAMNEIENVAKDLGMVKIELHVFAHNQAARSLYKKLGYEETNIRMAKKLTNNR